MRPGKFVAVAGNIGVGKTNLTTLLANHLGWKAYYEPVIDNPYLDDFYVDMHRWSFHLQVYFLSKRFEIHREMIDLEEPCIQDRTIYEDKEIFAATLYRQGFMSDRDYSNYVDLFEAMTSFLRTPDLIVYLRAGVGTLSERIRCRGRDCERDMDPAYLAALNDAYEDWVARASRKSRVLTVDTEGLNLVADDTAIASTLSEIVGLLGPDAREPRPVELEMGLAGA
jgi:deoxyadenosine/deoxycytidine kinase